MTVGGVARWRTIHESSAFVWRSCLALARKTSLVARYHPRFADSRGDETKYGRRDDGRVWFGENNHRQDAGRPARLDYRRGGRFPSILQRREDAPWNSTDRRRPATVARRAANAHRRSV